MEDLFNIGEDQFSSLSEMNEEISPAFPSTEEDMIGSTVNSSGLSPYDSGFDSEHPMPTYEQLLNAGFNPREANYILYDPTHNFSQRELFHCLYESDDPHEAYNELERQKTRELIDRTDQTIKSAEELLRRL